MAETDLTALPSVTEETVVGLLRERFERARIFTKLGDEVLMKVNPFEDVKTTVEPEVDGPRIEDLADKAFVSALRTRASFSCVMTGESGSGKTEATKVYLNELAGGSRCANQGLQVQLIDSCTLLESYGNCATEHNHNSSRFARWFELRLSPSQGRVVSGRVHQYLLEKARVVNGSAKSSNFHVLYDICQSFEGPAQADNKALQREEHFAYLCGRSTTSGSAQRWERMIEQLGHMGVSTSNVAAVTNALWCVLHLGNLEFVDEDVGAGADSCKLDPDSHEALEVVTDLLGMGKDTEAVETLFIKRKLQTGRESILQPRTASQARETRDALAKDLYSRIFRYIISVINESIDAKVGNLGASNNDDKVTVSILDIFGFERFENNSFEQLCINYGNEKLVQQFHEVLVRAEIAVCREEGVPEGSIGVEDAYEAEQAAKEATLSGISSAFHMIQDETRLPKATDSSLTKKILQLKLGEHVKLSRVGNPVHFTVNHYAGLVVYNADGFLDKNRDEGPRGVDDVIGSSSSNEFLRALFTSEESGEDAASKKAGAKPRAQAKQKTLGVKFRDEFTALATELAKSQQQFVMCIKPNREAVPKVFLEDLVRDQLEANGTLTICKVRQSAFAEHVPKDKFVERYGFLADAHSAADAGSLTGALIESEHLNAEDVFVGKTRILLRSRGREMLDACCEERAQAAAKMQAFARSFVARRKYLRMQQAAIRFQTMVRGKLARQGVAARRVTMHTAAVKVQSLFRMIVARAEADELREIKHRTAAIRVQAFARMALAVRRFKRTLRLARWRRQKETSAIAIQALVRRWLRAQRAKRAQKRLEMKKAAEASLAAARLAEEKKMQTAVRQPDEVKDEDVGVSTTSRSGRESREPSGSSTVARPRGLTGDAEEDEDRVNAALLGRATIPRGRRKPSVAKSSKTTAATAVGAAGMNAGGSSSETPGSTSTPPPPPLPLLTTIKGAATESSELTTVTPPVSAPPPVSSPKADKPPPVEMMREQRNGSTTSGAAAGAAAGAARGAARGASKSTASVRTAKAMPADGLDVDHLIHVLAAILVQRTFRAKSHKWKVREKVRMLRETSAEIDAAQRLDRSATKIQCVFRSYRVRVLGHVPIDTADAPKRKTRPKSAALGMFKGRIRSRKASNNSGIFSSHRGSGNLVNTRGSHMSLVDPPDRYNAEIDDDQQSVVSSSGRSRRLSTQFRRFSSAFRGPRSFASRNGMTDVEHYSGVAERDPRYQFLTVTSPVSGNSPVSSGKSPPPSSDPEYGALMRKLEDAAERRNVAALTQTLRTAYERGYISGPEVESAEAVLAQIRMVHIRQMEMEQEVVGFHP